MGKLHTISLQGIADEPEDRLVIKPFAQEDVTSHDHNCFELAYVIDGTAEQTLEGVTERVGRGDYFIIDCGSSHSYQNCREFTLLNCLFFAEVIDSTMAGCRSFDELMRVCLIRYHRQYFGETPANRIFHDRDGRVLLLLEGMREEYIQRHTGYREIFRGRLLEILILTMRQAVGTQGEKDIAGQLRNTAKSDVIFEVINYLEAHYEQRAVLQSFCGKFHYSLPYISRRFRQETGMTALDYLQKIRVEKCCGMLAGSNQSIQSIAREAGYEDTKFFNQVFKRLVGLTPGEYRKAALHL
ncbi:AraC family transcriptional regulator [Acetatifactor muris]|uniref:AraC family transcriptional regulator n=1 Tax=Acetatifactor muris TaxID=879566 RepID=UPI0023F13C56|nr:AraC family transcriptional regulator [Acetatifactor muris]